MQKREKRKSDRKNWDLVGIAPGFSHTHFTLQSLLVGCLFSSRIIGPVAALKWDIVYLYIP